MSAKLTVIFFILICFQVGVLLAVLPWTNYWSDNFFLIYLANHVNWAADIIMSGYTRGAVTGLGLTNILIGISEIANFKKTVQALSEQD